MISAANSISSPRIDSHSSITPLLLASILLQIYAGLGWIALYPYGGYVQLLSIAVFLALRVNHIKWVIVFLPPLLFWAFLPREYGAPNTAQLLSLISFVLLVSLGDKKLFAIHRIFAKTLCFLCIASLCVFALTKFDLWGEGRHIDLDPQFFQLRWPFYVERLNISKGSLAELFIFSSRFHGPFFEPGLLGVAIGVSLFSGVSLRVKLALIFFGIISFSMAFFALFLVKIGEVLVVKRKVLPILFVFAGILIAYAVLPKDSFAYNSIFGRFLGEGDKVLNTRTSVHELEQIALIEKVLRTDYFVAFAGLGWNIPGSGGSYRTWLASVGLFGMVVSFMYFVCSGIKSLGGINIKVASRTVVLALCCYLFGNWCAPFFLFIYDSGDDEAVS